jgi:hypothetical protein
VPEGHTLENMQTFWATHRLTGDNTKERPYATIYPHLTTRSNTFELHVVAESIEKNPDTPSDVFDPALDRVAGRVQKRVVIEWRIDPNNPEIPDFAEEVASGMVNDISLDDFGSTAVIANEPAPVELIDWRHDTAGGRLEMTWRSAYGQPVQLEASNDLVDWVPQGVFSSGEAVGRNADASLAAPFSDETVLAIRLPPNTRFFRLRSVTLAP